MADKKKSGPRYKGIYRHIDEEGGYSIWIPIDWHKTEMSNGHHGAVYHPNPNRIDTCISTEKVNLEYPVTEEDIPTLREGFEAGLKRLPGLEIESQDETITETLKMFEARFTFLEDDIRRKRWLRVIYWGTGELIVMAQGATPEEFDYWLPMFFNSLKTIHIPVMANKIGETI